MTGQVPAKLRLVRCPKCRRVLPELANVPVYQCGGCGTVLQAKKHKVTAEDAQPPVTESVPVPKNEAETMSSVKEAQNIGQEEQLPSTGHHPVGTNSEDNQTEVQVCNREHSFDAESSPEISAKLMHLGNKKLTPEVDGDESIAKDAMSSDGSSEELIHRGSVESTPEDEDECASKDPELSTGFPEELVHHAEVESTPETDNCVPKDAESSSGMSEDLMDHEHLVSSPDVGIDECVSEDAKSLSGHLEQLVNHGNVETALAREECLPKQIGGGDEKKNEHCNDKPYRHASFSDELVYSTELNHLELGEDENETFMELTNETKLNGSLPVVEANVVSDEDFRSHVIFGSSPEDEILDGSVLNNDRLSPCSEELERSHNRASFYNLEHMSSVDTLDNVVALRDMPESPMTKSYYGFYGSGSSCDGTDDQVPDRKFQIGIRNIEENEFTNNKSWARNREVSNKTRGNSEMQGQNAYFSSSSSGNRRRAHHSLPLYETKTETIGYQPRVPPYPRDQGVGRSNGSYSNHEMRTEFHIPNKREYLEVEKLELLKRIGELQDQLNRTHISEGKQNGNFSTPDPYHDDFIYNQEFGRYHEGRSGFHQSRLSRIPFSSEAPTSRNKVDRYCLQRPNLSGDIALHSYNVKSDTRSGPQNYSSAIQLRAERLYLGKKHALPVAGGASFLLCYGCSEVLQIPADFLLFKRRYHKLKCGSCSILLKFSLENRTHMVKYIDHSSKDLSQIDPVSIDDIEPSFCQSISTEETPYPIEPQFDNPKRKSSGKKKSNSKKGNKFTNFVKSLGPSRSSSKRSKAESSTSESEEVPASANSPLHRLMGYHSATILLKSGAEL